MWKFCPNIFKTNRVFEKFAENFYVVFGKARHKAENYTSDFESNMAEERDESDML